MNVRIQKGDIGTIIRRRWVDQDRNVINVSTATVKEARFRAPDGTVFTRNMVFTNTGSDGKVQYALASGDINQSGAWQVQFRIVYASIDMNSPIEKFQVGPRLT